jgi:hypothetical protein
VTRFITDNPERSEKYGFTKLRVFQYKKCHFSKYYLEKSGLQDFEADRREINNSTVNSSSYQGICPTKAFRISSTTNINLNLLPSLLKCAKNLPKNLSSSHANFLPVGGEDGMGRSEFESGWFFLAEPSCRSHHTY